MMRRLVSWLVLAGVWAGAAGAVAGFWMPWATLKVRHADAADGVLLSDALKRLTRNVGRVVIHVKRGAETITGELPDLSTLPSTIRGADIPALANRQDIKGAAAIAELVTGQQDLGQVGVRSYAVYLAPILAVVFALLVTVWPRPWWVGAAVGAASLAIAGVWWWKLATANTETAVVVVTLGRGLWVSCVAYAALGAAALARAIDAGARRAV